MSTERAKLSHEERTSAEPRQQGIHFVNIAKIEEVNSDIRLLKLSVQDRENGLKFLPGQWLDVYIPGIPKAGGFTITSTPSLAQPPASAVASCRSPPIRHDEVVCPLPPDVSPPLIELAVQRSSNPPAQWIWRACETDRTQLGVRVGGSFVWPPPPPPTTPTPAPKKVLFVAGGVGINPLISILTHLHQTNALSHLRVRFVYATKAPPAGAVLFLDRLLRIAAHAPNSFELKLCVTGQAEHVERVAAQVQQAGLSNVEVLRRRVGSGDVLTFVGAQDETETDGVGAEVLEERCGTVAYVCGPQRMTDEFVGLLGGVEGLGKERVLCEKWW
ncbi:hypothetical protein IWZ03DRAFT_395174 [Phyllosticta citriasiana]|uniref:FAD-binding FR-type domain-containing protein n=1 Tax=Phyllosticta citriasiana TaxID=595635 RepID=A0ABR1KM66_9PEZI